MCVLMTYVRHPYYQKYVLVFCVDSNGNTLPGRNTIDAHCLSPPPPKGPTTKFEVTKDQDEEAILGS